MGTPATPFHLLKKTLDLERPTTTTSPIGGVKRTYSSLATGVPCRAQPQSVSEGPRYGAESTRRTWRFYVPGSQDVRETDRVKFTVGGDEKIMDIVEVVNPQEEDTIKRLICLETEP